MVVERELVDFQLDAQNSYLFTYNTFIKHVLSIPEAVYMQLQCRLPEDEPDNARNM